MTLDTNRLCVLFGFVSCISVVILTIIRQRRFEVADVGSFLAAFFGGANIPVALFLCAYAFYPDPAEVHTKLHGMEKYISFAGLALLLVSFTAIWSLCNRAYVNETAHEPRGSLRDSARVT
jgi:hypothetical protein